MRFAERSEGADEDGDDSDFSTVNMDLMDQSCGRISRSY